MITTKHMKILNRLIKFALDNEPSRRKHFAAVKCGKTIYFGENSYEKGSSANKEGYLYPYPHAEYSIASKFRSISELYVIRINKQKQFINSNPCQYCRIYLKNKGIKEIIYSTENGFVLEKLV